MVRGATNRAQTGSSKETKHSQYYANHRLERQAQARDYKRKRAAASKLLRSTDSKQCSTPPTQPCLSLVQAERHLVPIYQEYFALRNSIDDWANRAVPQFPVMRPEFERRFSTHLFSGSSLSSELHLFLDRYTSNLAAFDDLDIWHFFKGICAMQKVLGAGRARLVFEISPEMDIPQPSWGGAALWAPQALKPSTETIYQRVLTLRARVERLKKISQKIRSYKGGLVWRYEGVEDCIHSARNLYLEWYTMLDDLEEDPDKEELLMFLKETSRTSYELGQTLEFLICTLRTLPKK
ncbi:hypothetical protein GYMLUDRAFT_56599 [Collybiopsis luxurians FD-317 M1]|nr:hypothetical protein GYMLUDRAFT_56599 [Collybiopsis luxurians FD-317 M1]